MNERIGIVSENSIAYINALIDIWNNGDCAVLIDWRIPPVEIIQMLIEIGTKKCYIEESLIGKEFFNDKIEFHFLVRHNNQAQLLQKSVYDKYQSNYSLNEAVILFSSGTTGRSKGIILSHYAISKNADSIIQYLELKQNDCIYIVKALSHSSSLTGELLVGLKTNRKILISPTLIHPRLALKNMSDFAVTIVVMNPTLLSLYLDEIERHGVLPTTLRKIYSCGAILHKKTMDRAKSFLKNIPVYNAYGLTEAGPRVSVQTDQCCNGNSAGWPIEDVQVKILNNENVECMILKPGIIFVKTPSKFSGYANAENRINQNEWLRTGDIGYFDDHKELYILGREDDMIVQSAHNVFPESIENVVNSHIEVKECVAFGIPDGLQGSRIICLYVSSTGRDLSRELRCLCNNRLASYEIPHKFLRVEEIPHTRNGKILRKQISEFYNNEGAKNEK